MTALSLAASENFTIRQEEGQQSQPLVGDPGGDTNWGITLARLSEWRGDVCTAKDVYNLRFEEAAAIFHGGYWNALMCDRLWQGLDLMVADHAFNCGVEISAEILQTLLGVKVDHRIGPITIRAATFLSDRANFLYRLRVAQEADYRTKANFPLFGDEWTGNPKAKNEWRRLGRLGRRYQAALAILP